MLHRFFAEQAEGEAAGEEATLASGAMLYGGPDGADAMVPTWNNFGGFNSVAKLMGRKEEEASLEVGLIHRLRRPFTRSWVVFLPDLKV